MAKTGKNIRLSSWNVNGIRAATKGGLVDWLKSEDADVVCFQEIKAVAEQLPAELGEFIGKNKYHAFWSSAEKAGYSGVGLLSKVEPLSVQAGIGHPVADIEGRSLTAEFSDFYALSLYFPNSQRDHARLGFKLEFCAAIEKHIKKLMKTGKHVVLMGDFNIAHNDIDLRNPKTNRDNAGFLPEERAWMEKFLNAGFVDAFRHFEQGGGHYTWWSYRPGVREKNVGWRIDYHVTDAGLKDRLVKCEILPDVFGSDHCPIRLEMKV